MENDLIQNAPPEELVVAGYAAQVESLEAKLAKAVEIIEDACADFEGIGCDNLYDEYKGRLKEITDDQ